MGGRFVTSVAEGLVLSSTPRESTRLPSHNNRNGEKILTLRSSYSVSNIRQKRSLSQMAKFIGLAEQSTCNIFGNELPGRKKVSLNRVIFRIQTGDRTSRTEPRGQIVRFLIFSTGSCDRLSVRQLLNLLLINPLQLKRQRSPVHSCSHLNGHVSGVIAVPDPQLAFIANQSFGSFRLCAHGIECSRGGLDLLACFHVQDHVH